MMITTYEVFGQEDIAPALGKIRSGSEASAEVMLSVKDTIEEVRQRGDGALARLTKRFDGVSLSPDEFEVAESERRQAWEDIDSDAREALLMAEKRIALFARESLAKEWEMEVEPGLMVGQAQRPLETVGIYVPGGRFPYPSTVLMSGVLAREAGVPEINFCVPPGDGGFVSRITLAATTLVDGCKVFRAGGAQAIAAMAYGTETIPRCKLVAGPGNIYVATAKRLLSDVVSVDLEAGPSEVAAYVDSTVDISFAAADMLAQLEHDPLAVSAIVSESSDVLESARGVLSGFADGLDDPEPRGSVSLVLCASRSLAIDFLNALAPEHLELMVDEAQNVLPDIHSAGCVFIGPYSPVALGDYVAGPSHVLPTGGTAARLSGLNAQDFRRTMNVISYTEQGFRSDAPQAKLIARLEGLKKHAFSIEIRERS
ncbi:MAG TPA: histidinol dehydrogenase [Candidatus Anoxymicrobiaceae bacterium]|jgi:histidinol dehydrogenase